MNGAFETTGNDAGSVITFACNDGFELRGQKVAFCLTSGKWSMEKPPECHSISQKITDCSAYPPMIEHGKYTVSTHDIGGRAHYTCDEGFTFQGGDYVECLDTGLWSDAPVCIEISKNGCPAPEVVENGLVSFPDTITAGSVAVYSCNKDFTLEGSSVLFCLQNGNWTPEAPKCKAVANSALCDIPPDVENGKSTFWSTPFGSIAMYSCEEGYVLEGPSVAFCSSETRWSDIPSCEAPHQLACPPPPSVRHGLVSFASLHVQSVAIYSCEEGFELIGSNVAVCLPNATWSEPPNCHRPETFAYLDSAFTIGEGAFLSLPTPAMLIPPGATISPEQSTEKITLYCDEPPMVSNAMVSVLSRQVGSTAVYRCSEGFEPHGSSVVTCFENQTWSEPLTCREIRNMNCGAPPAIRNGRVLNKITGEPGSYAEYVCLPGMRLVGQGSIMCNEGEWEFPPECKPILCPLPDFVENGVVEFTRLAVGATAVYSCENGFDLVGSSVLTCMESGDWDDEWPVCIGKVLIA